MRIFQSGMFCSTCGSQLYKDEYNNIKCPKNCSETQAVTDTGITLNKLQEQIDKLQEQLDKNDEQIKALIKKLES